MFLVACFHVTHVMGGIIGGGGVLVLPKMPFACQNPMGGEGGIMTGGVNVVVAGVYCGRVV